MKFVNILTWACGAFFILVGVGILSVWMTSQKPDTTKTSSTPPTRIITNLAPLRLVKSSGRTYTTADLTNRLTVISFIFTRCMGPCPMATAQLKSLQDHFRDFPQIHFLSVTIDPEHDTNEELEKYSRRFQADPKRWAFVTGPVEGIHQFARETLKLSASDDPALHSTMFVLVDKDLSIHGYYNSQDRDALTRLKAELRSLI